MAQSVRADCHTSCAERLQINRAQQLKPLPQRRTLKVALLPIIVQPPTNCRLPKKLSSFFYTEPRQSIHEGHPLCTSLRRVAGDLGYRNPAYLLVAPIRLDIHQHQIELDIPKHRGSIVRRLASHEEQTLQ